MIVILVLLVLHNVRLLRVVVLIIRVSYVLILGAGDRGDPSVSSSLPTPPSATIE